MIIVTSIADSGAGTLRQAIDDAAVGEEITFAVTGTILLSSEELLIEQDVVITGPGFNDLLIDGANSFRIFNVSSGEVSISGLTIHNGNAVLGAGIHNEAALTLDNVVITDCTSSNDGGGIWNSSGIEATDCEISGCAADGGNGGGIHNTGTFTAESLVVTGCQASQNGAGIYNEGTYTHEGGSITGNEAGGGIGGGGVYTTGTCDLAEVSISGNISTGNSSGGLFNQSATTTIERCAIISNTGAGLYNQFGTLNLDNSTVASNTTYGIINGLGSTTVLHSTITGNLVGITMDSGSELIIQNTILCGNSNTDYDGETVDGNSLGNNIVGTQTNPMTAGPDDQTGVLIADVHLGPLQGNGGPTFTHALLSESVALDTGNSTDAPDTDQRGTGFPRVQNGTIDIGAYEAEPDDPGPNPDPDPDPQPEPEPEPSPEPVPGVTLTVSDADCRRVSCCNSATGVQFNDFTYSLVNGQSYTNEEFTLVVPCPEGYDCTADSVTITLPPGTVIFTPTVITGNPPASGSGNPWTPEPGNYVFTCGSQKLTVTTGGTGFTDAQLQTIIQFLATCQATQDGNAILQPTPVTTPSGAPGLRIYNTEQTCTEECPEGETGDPVTVTIPAKTNSVIVAATATPLAKYLAQQQINAETLAQACAEATAALDCTPEAECPEFKSSFDSNITNGASACQYGLTGDLMYVMGGATLTVKAFDIADAEQLTASFPGYSGVQRGMAWSLDQNKLYVSAEDTGLSENRIKVLDATDLNEVVEIDINPFTGASNVSLPRYIETLDSVVITGNGAILLIDCATDAITLSDATGDLDNNGVAYAPAVTSYYCPVSNFPAAATVVVRDATLAPTTSITLTACDTGSGSNALLVNGKIIVAAAALADDTTTIFVIDPATNTVTNTIVSGVDQGPISAEYDPSLNLVYIQSGTSLGFLIVFNPETEEILCELSSALTDADHRQTGINTTTDRFYISQGNAAGQLNKYGQP